MSTSATTSSPSSLIRPMKSRLPASSSSHSVSNNGHCENHKSNRIYAKKPSSTSNVHQNGFKNHSNKSISRTSSTNHQSRAEPIKATPITRSPSPPIVFHAIAPAPQSSLDEPQKINDDTEATNDPEAEANRRIAKVLAHAQIKTMSTAVSSCTEDEDEHDKPSKSSVDTDADESDHENPPSTKSIIKSRRMVKNRKISFTSANPSNGANSTPPTSKSVVRPDESSNDDEVHELNNNADEPTLNNRRLKGAMLKRSERHVTTTTTTDDDSSRHRHRHHYHPLENLEAKGRYAPSESNCSSPVPILTPPANTSAARKQSRFVVKSIRKSQQQQFLLANVVTAKSSNDDESSHVNRERAFPLKAELIERKHTNTPTTDAENGLSHADHIVHEAVSALKKVENGSGSDVGHHRVRFQIAQTKKQESAAEEDKSPVPTTSTPTPVPASSAASAPGEDEEEEEAVAKSPDNRFIKYAKEIGRGAFKTVYRGFDTETCVAVAWCELQDFAQFDKHERARFKEEAEMLKKLKHQNIVRFYDFWEETNPRTNKKVIILVTELMTSGSLKSYIKNFRGQREEKRINVMKKWCRQILKGLAYLHSRNPPVIHRDLKCDNVFISSTTGCVKIGDLGLATFKTQTFAKSMRGTMEFMAPEMFDEKYDELVDIYSFGLCMLEMITGEYPYLECKGPTAVIKRVTAGLKPDCYYKVESDDVREVIDCCIRTKKEERLSVHELLQHSFFMDDNGLKVELVRDSSTDSPVMVKNDTIDMKLKIVDKLKRKNLHAEHKVNANVFEAILFHYNLQTDTPDQIAEELMAKTYIFEDDKNFVIQSIKDRLRAYRYEQLDRQAGVFGRDGKHPVNPSSQPPNMLAATPVPAPAPAPAPAPTQPPLPAPAQPTPSPLINLPAATPIAPVNSNATPAMPSTMPVEANNTPINKLSNEVPPVKPVISTEPAPINPINDLTANMPGSAGSLEVLEAALKKTFTKTNVPSNANPSSTVLNDPSETSSTLINQDDSSLIPKTENNAHPNVFEQSQVNPELSLTMNGEGPSNLLQSSNQSTILQTQSQPTTMLSNATILQNPILLSQPSQSFSYSPHPPPSQHIVNTSPLTTDTLKPAINPSLSSTTETTENPSNSISPSATPSAVAHPSDAPQNDAPPQVSGSLEQLEVLLKNTFKKQNRTAGTAHSSDGEAANPATSSIPPLNNEEKLEFEAIPADPNPSMIDVFPVVPPSSTTSLPTSKATPVLSESAHFDPLVSRDTGSLRDLETLLQSTFQKAPSIVEEPARVSPQPPLTSHDELADLKSMIVGLSRTLLTKMNVIESKIDEHCQQTRKINQMLTDTVLPAILDITDIIHETSPQPLDERVRTKLETIQHRVRSSQQMPFLPTTETKDLMDL